MVKGLLEAEISNFWISGFLDLWIYGFLRLRSLKIAEIPVQCGFSVKTAPAYRGAAELRDPEAGAPAAPTAGRSGREPVV
jgi:hypothetical protein